MKVILILYKMMGKNPRLCYQAGGWRIFDKQLELNLIALVFYAD